jgi:hypothetical protein
MRHDVAIKIAIAIILALAVIGAAACAFSLVRAII